MSHPIDRRSFVAHGLLATSALSLPATAAWAARAAAVRYRITDLGDLGGSTVKVSDVNDAGAATGMATRHDNDNRGVAFLARNGRMRGLKFLRPGVPSYGSAVNASGVVCGYDADNFVDHRATAWYASADGERHYLPALQGRLSTYAYDINDQGEITGESYGHAFVYRNGQTLPLGELPGFNTGYGASINNHGDIAGGLGSGTAFVAFTVFDGVMQALNINGAASHYATALNNQRQVCGTYDRQLDLRSINRAFLWQDGVAQDLGSLGGDDAPAQAAALNDAGVVVGTAWRPKRPGGTSPMPHAFVMQGEQMVDMNDLLDDASAGWLLRKATAINNLGVIVGQGEFNGARRAFLATPISSS